MDGKILNGLYVWIDSLKEEARKKAHLAEDKSIELAVLELRKDMAEESVDKIEDGLSREKFYNKFIKEVDEEIGRVKAELSDLRSDRKEFTNHVNALENAIQRSSYRRE
ncbi:hypothetical protein [Paenibacillus sp. FSL H7-0918]|uniref:hypothetical protein n=1 Tax=Paenibacillus sp. FSL H7-0918 TaxID=2921442 RepID=UPI0030FC16FD